MCVMGMQRGDAPRNGEWCAIGATARGGGRSGESAEALAEAVQPLETAQLLAPRRPPLASDGWCGRHV